MLHLDLGFQELRRIPRMYSTVEAGTSRSPHACDLPRYVHEPLGYPTEVHRDSQAPVRVTFPTSLTPFHVQDPSDLALLILCVVLAV